jgi:cytochrome c nitrite reductase small subunit
VTSFINALALFFWPMAVMAADLGDGVPAPRGWIGTTTEWAQGLGIVFALLDLVLLAVVWWSLRAASDTPVARGLLFVALGVLPLMVVFFGYSYGLEAAKSVNTCGACHVMRPWVEDLRNPASTTLAATHFKNRFILENQCYTCHSDYGMFGTVEAKWEGLGHAVRNLTGAYRRPITIVHPYPNSRCLACHGQSQRFLKSTGHPKEVLPHLMAGTLSCLDCHGPAHLSQGKSPRAASNE